MNCHVCGGNGEVECFAVQAISIIVIIVLGTEWLNVPVVTEPA